MHLENLQVLLFGTQIRRARATVRVYFLLAQVCRPGWPNAAAQITKREVMQRAEEQQATATRAPIEGNCRVVISVSVDSPILGNLF